jgi:polysaccharide chain length determinant protein (PEP-CTERM system associated)
MAVACLLPPPLGIRHFLADVTERVSNAMPENDSSLNQKLEPITRLLTRRRWYILSVAVATALTTIVVLYQLPNRYTSEAVLFVVEQQVPQRYVTPTDTTELGDALPAMTQQVLSRSRLLELVEQFNLYAPSRKGLMPEEIDALMRQDIKIEPLAPSPGHRSKAFKISFTTSKAILAQEVTSKLTSLFIQENLKTREDQARNTTSFLHERLEIARQKLEKQESLLREFKTKFLGELPEQQQGNLAILGGAQLQLQNISASLNRAQQQRVYLESLISGYRRLLSRGNTVPGESPHLEASRVVTPYQSAQEKLAQLQAQKAHLLIEYQPGHPDVLAINREIASEQALVDGLKPKAAQKTEAVQTQPAQGAQKPPTTSTETEADASIAQLNSQLESNRVEIANLLKDENQQKTIISSYQGRLNLTPVREQQLAGILRDYELSKQDYADLLGKEQQSQLAMSLEQQQAGQQFRLVEPPSLPALPSSPQRLKMSLSGIGAGLVLGFVTAVLLELMNPVFYTEKDLTRHFSIPLVVGLPLLVNPAAARRLTWIRLLECFGGMVLVAAVLTAEAWVIRHP